MVGCKLGISLQQRTAVPTSTRPDTKSTVRLMSTCHSLIGFQDTSFTSTSLVSGTADMTNMIVPQLANMGTVESGQVKANWVPLSMGPHVFHTTHWRGVWAAQHLVARQQAEQAQDVPSPRINLDLCLFILDIEATIMFHFSHLALRGLADYGNVGRRLLRCIPRILLMLHN